MARSDLRRGTGAEREQAFANIEMAAGHYGVEMTAASWKESGEPHRKDFAGPTYSPFANPRMHRAYSRDG